MDRTDRKTQNSSSKIEYRTGEMKTYTPPNMETESTTKKVNYEQKHTAFYTQDSDCKVQITIDVGKLERKRMLSRFNKA